MSGKNTIMFSRREYVDEKRNAIFGWKELLPFLYNCIKSFKDKVEPINIISPHDKQYRIKGKRPKAIIG